VWIVDTLGYAFSTTAEWLSGRRRSVIRGHSRRYTLEKEGGVEGGVSIDSIKASLFLHQCVRPTTTTATTHGTAAQLDSAVT
jgi:hypothetical protein